MSQEVCQREYAHSVATPKPGFNNKIDNLFGNWTGITNSPRPRQIAADSETKNGTSDPTASAIFATAFGDNPVSSNWFSASSVEAASLLPPPNPAPCGILFLRSIETAGSRFVTEKKAFAARTTRFSSPLGTDGSSHEKPIPFWLLCLSILNSSQSEIGAMNVSIS